MIKIGDRVRFLNDGTFEHFENYRECYGIVTTIVLYDRIGVEKVQVYVDIYLENGQTHPEFERGVGWAFDPDEYEKIEEVKT